MFRKNRLTLLTGIVVAALVAGTPAAASSWTVDPSKSSLTFVATQNGAPVEGRFAGWSAEITLDPQAPETGRIRAVIDTASAVTGQGQVDQTLTSAAWFDPASHPDAVFESGSITALGDDRYEAVGTLTIKGTARELVLPFTLSVDGDSARAQADVSLARLVFGIGSDIPEATVANDVTVRLDIAATR
ncbi:YceI family protein [Stappia sp.]|jgi:polyisoprenoid-binding protein YceI|uniref:YceI family protein n=1 Tax=Stappia sp. TaxID=1870903 RepID=UPI003D0A0A32